MPDDPRRRSTLSRIGGVLRRGAQKVRGRRNRSLPDGPVTLQLDGHESVEVPVGTTILAAALQAGIDVPHYCGGTCSCGTCRVEILAGADQLSPTAGREQMVLGADRTRAGDRLACQARILGPACVRVPDWF